MAKNIVYTNGKDPVAIARHKLGTVEFMRGNAYANLNEIASTFGKRIDNWTRLKSTTSDHRKFTKTQQNQLVQTTSGYYNGDEVVWIFEWNLST